MTFETFFQETLLPALLTVGGVFVTALTGMAIDAIRKWAEKQKNATIALVLQEVANVAERAVATVNQTFVDEIRLAHTDGTLTKGEAQNAMGKALMVARTQLGNDGWAALVKVAGSEGGALKVLTDMIEGAVGSGKPPKPPQSASEFLGG